MVERECFGITPAESRNAFHVRFLHSLSCGVLISEFNTKGDCPARIYLEGTSPNQRVTGGPTGTVEVPLPCPPPSPGGLIW